MPPETTVPRRRLFKAPHHIGGAYSGPRHLLVQGFGDEAQRNFWSFVGHFLVTTVGKATGMWTAFGSSFLSLTLGLPLAFYGGGVFSLLFARLVKTAFV
jgi:hypothetical protein